MVAWGVTDRGFSDPLTVLLQDVNTTVHFAVPFTWGTAFDLGIFANALAGENATGGTPFANTASIAFQNSFTWAGPGYVRNFVDGVLDTRQLPRSTSPPSLARTTSGLRSKYRSRPHSP